jgi:anti-sigma factor RsiW
MNCEAIIQLLSLYYYGELSPQEEEQVDEHIHVCPGCAGEMERQRALAAALDRRAVEPAAELLEECRAGLLASLEVPAAGALRRAPAPGAWRLFLDAMGQSMAGLARWRQPLGAAALVALGFFGARFATSPANAPSAAPSEHVFATIRSVQPGDAGRVRIDLDETRRRVVQGNLNDPHIRQLLLAATREDNNAAVRVESVDLLKSRPEVGDVRAALVNAVMHDPNAGVRLKALEGLKPLASDPEVRRALAQVLQTDESTAVRMQVVDLLVLHRDDSMIGLLQDLVQKENDGYLRLKCEKALKEMNASVGTF